MLCILPKWETGLIQTKQISRVATTLGADLYLTGINPDDASVHKAKPCPLCARMIIQAGIKNVVLRQGDGIDNYIILPADELKWCL